VNNIIALAKEELIQIYKSDNKLCLQMVTWAKHQQIRAKKSKYPSPNGTGLITIENIYNQLLADANGNQLLADANNSPRNPIQSNPIRNPIQSNTTHQTIPSEIGTKLAGKLRDLILLNNPKGKTPKDLTVWARDIDRMIKLDNRTELEIINVMEFSQRDSFWKTNILSVGKLRQQFDQLYLKSKTIKISPFSSKNKNELPTEKELEASWRV
jgi:hypothetical protein